MATPRNPGDHEGLPALVAALRTGADPTAALLHFRALLSRPSLASGLARWIEAGWAAFTPEAGQRGLDQAIEAARGSETAAGLLLARVAFGTGHRPAALAALRTVAAREPGQGAPVFLLCAMLLKQGDAAAHGLLQRCLRNFPQASEGWAEIGDALLALGKKEAALVCFGKSIPDYALALRRGLLARELGRREEARAAFEEAVRLDGTAPRAWFLLGTAAQDEGDQAGAAAAYRAVLALDPKVAEAAVNLGTVLQEAGDLEGARAAYGRAVATRAETFGRVAQALATPRKGELWLDLAALRHSLAG